MAMFDVMEKGGGKNADRAVQRQNQFARHENHTGIPAQMKNRLEESTGLSFDDVRVHYNSALPARLDALAYTQGNRVEIAPGQERHLPHELGHVVQQKLGAVRANARHSSGVEMNTDEGLERQADEIGAGKKVGIARKAGNSVVQRQTTPKEQSENGKGKVREFFVNVKNSKNINVLNVYSRILADGLGDAGQLGLLYKKIKAHNITQNVRLMCTFDTGNKETINERREAIKKCCGVSTTSETDEDFKYITERTSIRERAFKSLGDCDWEVEYPVPDRDFKTAEGKKNQLLKIKEMGQELETIRSGDTAQGGIGYGIPDTPKGMDAVDSDSAETFLRTMLDRKKKREEKREEKPEEKPEEKREEKPEDLLEKAWIVSIKNYKWYEPTPLLRKDKIMDIVKEAKEAGAKFILFAGMSCSVLDEIKDNNILICDGNVKHETLMDLMIKIKNGVIISGGEGLFVESLASPDQNTVSVLAGRYVYQYIEIANVLANMETLGEIHKNDKYHDKKDTLESYRIFAFGKDKPYTNFYYYTGDQFVSLTQSPYFDGPLSFDQLWTKETQDYMLCYSKALSALYLPVHLNCGDSFEKPKEFDNISQMFDVFKSYKSRFVNESWFKLIDEAVAAAGTVGAATDTSDIAADTTEQQSETSGTNKDSYSKCCTLI